MRPSASTLRRLERAKRITTPEANAAQDHLIELEIELLSFEPFADRIRELRRVVTSYGAGYVAVGEALEFPLGTLDERLTKAEGPKCGFMTPGSRSIAREILDIPHCSATPCLPASTRVTGPVRGT